MTTVSPYKNNFVKAFLFMTTPLLLSGCDLFDHKEPLPGKREVLFSAETAIKTETPGASISLSAPKGVINKDWSVPGGKLTNAMPPLALSDNLSQVWSTSIGSGTSSSKRLTSNAIVHQGVAYAMDTTGVVNAVSLNDGQSLWSTPTTPNGEESEALGGGIAAAGDKLFATTSFGHVIALDTKTGKQLWDKDLTNPIRIAPTVSDGKVFVVNIANETHALDVQSGEERWTHTGLPESTGILGGAVPAIDGGLILVPYSSGEIYALDIQTGQPKWVETLMPTASSDSLSSISHIRARPLIHDGTVYAISHGGRMVAVDLQNGGFKWQRDFAGIRTPALFGNYLYFVSIENELVCLDRHNGRVVWSVQLPTTGESKTKISWAGPVIAGGTLLLSGSNGQVIRHALGTGQKTSEFNAGSPLSLSPIIADGSLLLLTDSGNLTLWK